MDLIGSINYIGNMFGRRKPNQGRGKAGQKNSCNQADEKAASPDSGRPAAGTENRLGQKIDTTA